MIAFLPWTVAGFVLVFAISAGLRAAARRTLLASLRATWGQPGARDRDMRAIASYHYALVGDERGAPALDDRTWADLNMDDVFAELDRTQSSIGQQLLYHRLRTAPAAGHLPAFEQLVQRMSDDAPLRERTQMALAKLSDKAGYDLWSLAQPGVLQSRPWFVLFPILAVAMVAALAASFVWPQALLIVALGAVVSVATRGLNVSYTRLVLGPFRQLGPLVAVAESLGRISIAGAEPILGTIGDDVRHLSRLRRVAAWVSRESDTSIDPASIIIEYLNLLLLFDANALYFGARELAARSPELLRVIAAVGEADAAISVANFRMSAAWIRPVFREPGERVVFEGIRHPLVADAVPNSITLGPPHGLIVTGSNMSGKSTFLRTCGVTAVMAQTIHTCLAARYESPIFFVRSSIGRSDDILAGKSYYIVEVESVLGLVGDSALDQPHLFLFDELFRGTNAIERIAAGEAVLAELVRPHGDRPTAHIVIAATHDRELVDLLRDTYDACHLADTVGDEGLTFSYRLAPGPATTRNAIALLRIHGAPESLVDRALGRAEALDRERQRF